MFKISPIQDKQLQKECAVLCGAEYFQDAFAYTMNDAQTGELMGFSQFEITEKGGILLSLVPKIGYDDFEAMFILGRSTMNFIDMCGCNILYANSSSADEKLLKAIGLKKNSDTEYFCDMTGFFDGSHCSGHN